MKDLDDISDTQDQPNTFEDIIDITGMNESPVVIGNKYSITTMKMQPDLLSRNQGIIGTTGSLLPHTGIDLIQELLLSVHGLASVITNIQSKQEQPRQDIQILKEKQEKPTEN
jgi:hypothetical protein